MKDLIIEAVMAVPELHDELIEFYLPDGTDEDNEAVIVAKLVEMLTK